jgi:O-antigen ligase
LRTLLVVGVLAAPALLLGGRSGAEADASAIERLEAWDVGIEMFRSSPIWGIGKSEFTENYYLTAHNSFLLEAAELGLVGMILWLGVFYTSFKIVVSALRRYRDRANGIVPYTWARALLASLCGVMVGTSFLSLAYHPVIWIFFALPGAFYLATRRHDPDFRVGFGARDLLAITGFAVLLLVGTKAYLILRGV